jgi:hypothetical protein
MAGGMPATTETSTVSSISAAWIKNNVLAAVVAAAASLAIYGVRNGTGAAGADAGFAAIAVLLAAATVLSALAGIAYGVLTGAVLQRIVPMLPVKSWITVNAGMAVAASVLSEISVVVLPPAPADDDPSLMETLLAGVILGGALGAAIGGLQAFVLRRAAHGTSAWIVWSMVAYIVAVLLIAGSGKVWETGGGFANELATQAAALLAYAIISVVMLPALRRLRDPLSTAHQHFT